MPQLIAKPSVLQGQISIPPSKSHTMRAILFAALAIGKSHIENYLPSSDTDAMIHACRVLGATIKCLENKLEIIGINGRIAFSSAIIHAGNSGIILRFFTALSGICSLPLVVTGDDSIRNQRPLSPLLDGLRQLGVSVKSLRGNDFAPVIIQGPFQTDYACISGEDSQFVSGLLIAMAFANHAIELEVKNPGEKPWVALTLAWFDRLGIVYQNENFEHYQLQGHSSYTAFNYSVPGDFSSAAFPMAAALITNSKIILRNLDLNDSQGDKQLIFVLEKMGALFKYNECDQTLVVEKTSQLVGIDIDINDLIDALPILAVVACFAEGTTVIRNAKIARSKECDRIHIMYKELTKMGAQIIEKEDGLVISHSILHGQTVCSHGDHRVAMALAVAGLQAHGRTIIEDAACLSKTYTNFVEDFQTVGAQIKWQTEI